MKITTWEVRMDGQIVPTKSEDFGMIEPRIAKVDEMLSAIGDMLEAGGVVCNDLELAREVLTGKRDFETFDLVAYPVQNDDEAEPEPGNPVPTKQEDLGMSEAHPLHERIMQAYRDASTKLLPNGPSHQVMFAVELHSVLQTATKKW